MKKVVLMLAVLSMLSTGQRSFADHREFYLNVCTEADGDTVDSLTARKAHILRKITNMRPAKARKFMALYREREWLRDALLILNETNFVGSRIGVQFDVQKSAFVEMIQSARDNRQDLLTTQSRFQNDVSAPMENDEDDYNDYRQFQSRIQQNIQDQSTFVASLERQQSDLLGASQSQSWQQRRQLSVQQGQLGKLQKAQAQIQSVISSDALVVGAFESEIETRISGLGIYVGVSINLFGRSDLRDLIENRIAAISSLLKEQFLDARNEDVEELFERLNMVLGKLKLAKKVENLCSQVADLRDENDSLAQEAFGLRIRNGALRDSNQRLRAANVDLHNAQINLFLSFKRVKAKLHEKRERIRSLEAEVDRLQAKVQDLKERVRELEANQMTEETRRELRSLRNDVVAKANEITSKNNELASIRTQLSTKDRELTSLRSDLTTKRADITRLQAEIDALRREGGGNSAATIRNLQTQITAKDAQIATLNAAIAKSKSDIADLNDKIDQKEKRINKLKKKVRDLGGNDND